MLTQFLTILLRGAWVQERFNVAVTSTAEPGNGFTEPKTTLVAVIAHV
jgi:hypothetical protein